VCLLFGLLELGRHAVRCPLRRGAVALRALKDALLPGHGRRELVLSRLGLHTRGLCATLGLDHPRLKVSASALGRSGLGQGNRGPRLRTLGTFSGGVCCRHKSVQERCMPGQRQRPVKPPVGSAPGCPTGTTAAGHREDRGNAALQHFLERIGHVHGAQNGAARGAGFDLQSGRHRHNSTDKSPPIQQPWLPAAQTPWLCAA